MIPSKNEWMDALIARHGLDLHKRFSSATIAVCGLGGLGSNIAIALSRAGIGKLLLIDFDRVDITESQRLYLWCFGGNARSWRRFRSDESRLRFAG